MVKCAGFDVGDAIGDCDTRERGFFKGQQADIGDGAGNAVTAAHPAGNWMRSFCALSNNTPLELE